MKITGQFVLVSVVAFFLSLVGPTLSLILDYFRLELPLLRIYKSFFTTTDAVVVFIIAPLLIFAVFYFIGKKPDLKMELKPNLIALLIGNLASFLVSSTVIAFAMFNIYPFGDAFPIFVVYMLYSLLFYFATNLLAALGGLYIGYIRRKKGMGVVGDITIKNGAELPRL